MSQVLLGVRNLSLRIAVFVALAAALAWFLGGELFPHAKSLPRSSVEESGISARVVLWYTPDGLVSERAQWRLEVDAGKGAHRVEPAWSELTDPLIDRDGMVQVGALRNGAWGVWIVDPKSEQPAATLRSNFNDRLEVERQLARVAAGLPLQTREQAGAARGALLRAGDEG